MTTPEQFAAQITKYVACYLGDKTRFWFEAWLTKQIEDRDADQAGQAVDATTRFMVSSRGDWAFCSECGIGYTPKRKPATGKRNYCPRCVLTGVPGRNATRAYRERKVA